MTPLGTLQRAIGGGLIVALALVAAWGLRVDHLRAGHRARLDRIAIAIEEVTGARASAADAPVTIRAIGLVRDRYRLQRDEARSLVDRQTRSIRALADETQRQAAIGARNRQLALSALRERDDWIARAEAAETRTARRSAEAEAAECERVADALYRDGF
jgi:hypothetical protein